LITDATGLPLAILHTPANVHDSRMAVPLVDALPTIRRSDGRRRKLRPVVLLADKAYDASAAVRQPLMRRGIFPLIPRRGDRGFWPFARCRAVVESPFAWLNHQRRLRVRYERRDDIHEAFLALACGLTCWNRIIQF
jgi:transposase